MKISFFQTYGDNRKELLKIKLKDKKFIEFLSFFDCNIISFHNCNEETIKWFQTTNNIPNIKYLVNKEISYTQCIKRLLDVFYTLKGKYFFFHQDDTFSFDNNDINFKEFFNFIFLEQDLMLNLFASKKDFNNIEFYKKLNTIEIYKNTTYNFTNHGLWSFDDSPYICTSNYLPIVYDDNYLSYSDIWSAEHYLNNKFQIQNLKRFITNRCIFKNYNFIGPNNWNHDNEIKILKSKKLL